MNVSPRVRAELVELVARRTGHARLLITGSSMEPLLRAGMVIDVEPLCEPPALGDILVFQSRDGLIAHRLVGGERLGFRAHHGLVERPQFDIANDRAYHTSGDAQPDRLETVPARLVVGRVNAVWAGPDSGALRIDDRMFAVRGRRIAATRTFRALGKKLRAYAALLLRDPAHFAPPAFSIVVAATQLFETGRSAQGVAALTSIPAARVLEIARRHHLGGLLSHWLDAATSAGIDVSADLRSALQRVRWTNALQAGRVLACVRDVRDRFVGAGVPYILLKGGARLGAGLPLADLQFSRDVDVIVPAESAERALAVLRAAGYRDVTPNRAHAGYRAHHHREPLCPPGLDVPVEVHTALALPAEVDQRLDYAALEPFARRTSGPAGEITVLADVAAAVHLAYHARDLHVWRDIVLLGRLLRGFDAVERSGFDEFIGRERRDRTRLQSAVAAADQMYGRTTPQLGACRRYLAWAMLREDLPRRWAHTDIIEACVGQCVVPKLRVTQRSDVARWGRCWLRNVLLLPVIARVAYGRVSRRAPNAKPEPVTPNAFRPGLSQSGAVNARLPRADRKVRYVDGYSRRALQGLAIRKST